MAQTQFSEKQIKFIIGILLGSIILAFFLLALIERFLFLPQENFLLNLKVPQENPKVSLEMVILPFPTSSEEGEILPVEIYLDSQGRKVDGVGVVILYDPEFLEIEIPSGLKVENLGLSRILFPVKDNFPKGELRFSLISQPGRYFQGRGKIASLKFKILKEGITDLNFKFKPGATDDCNVSLYKKGVDILGEVRGGGQVSLTLKED